ncbi:acetyl-CoA synthetase [Oceanobacillus polygoni]|uniref:Acetyl-CoA synthetase n=1 Tax=Oceanobacillus polygoni TaxID=1235259 RepID=A0A9X0YTT0_9BACI|nr:acetyl-CoA synthetase [Oceanobacillus polygoni]
MLNRTDLIAPADYNIVMEMEKYAMDTDRTALIWEDEAGHTKEVSYEQLLRNVNRIGNAFLGEGLKRGDKVLIMIPRLIEAYEVYLAAIKVGVVVIPSSEMLKTKDLQYRVSHGEVRGIISYYPFVDQYKDIEEYDDLIKFVVGEPKEDFYFLDELREQQSDVLEIASTTKDDIAFISYTSGTTGSPKGVVHTHGWGYAHLRTAPEHWLSIKDGDKVWATAGPGWQKWVWTPFLSVLGTGATGYIYHGKFDAKKYLRLLEKQAINVLCCTPTEYRMMAKVDTISEYDLSTLTSAVSAGEPLNVEVIDVFRKHFNITVRDGYGQTENTLLLGVMKGMEVKPGSMGKPTPGNDVEIIDDEGKQVSTNEVGDIAVKVDSPALFREYYKDIERTKHSRRGDYYITGDRARKDADGYFWFEGRSDDIIISSGYTIGPFEVEDALVKHPFVQECAVVASPDEIRGSIVKAFVVLKNNLEKDEAALIKELQEHVKALTAPYKYPRKIEFLDELPKTTSGKIRRVELRQRETEK